MGSLNSSQMQAVPHPQTIHRQTIRYPFTLGSLIGVIAFIPMIALFNQVIGSLILGIFILIATWKMTFGHGPFITVSGAITGDWDYSFWVR